MHSVILLIAMTAAAVSASPFHAVETVILGNKFDYQYPLLLQRDANQHGTCEEEANPGGFTAYDYAVVIGMLVISCGIGVFYGFFDKNSSGSAADFMLGTEMSVFPVTLSLTTSFITAIELLGNPAEIFFNGGQFALIVVSMLLVIPVALYVFFPIYDQMKLTSCYEYLGMRFGKEMRVFGGSLYIIQMCFYTSVSVLAPAIALSKATGLNTRLAIVLIYVVCIFYSSQGGLKAVVIADTFQACVLFVSLIMIFGVGTYMQEGGISAIFQIANENDRLELFNFDPNPTTRHTVFSVIIGGFFYWASLLCVNQATVQKAMSLRNLSKAKIALTMSVFGLALVFLMNFYTGFMTFAKYETCDPFKAGKIDGIDQLIPFFVMETFGHLTTFVGIFVAGVFAASLGTVAACLSSLSAVTIEDILINGINMKIPPEQGARYAKFMNLAYGVISFGLIFLVEGRGILQATLTLNGLVGGLLLGIFSLGVFFKSANSKGALYGGALSTVAVLTLGIFALAYGNEEPFLASSVEGCSCTVNATAPAVTGSIEGRPWYANIYNISYMWYSMVGCLLTIFFGLIISNATHYCDEKRIRKLTGQEKVEKFSSRTSQPPSRKNSSASQKASGCKTPTAFEGKLSQPTSHVHHHYESNDDRVFIINEETLQAGQRETPLSVIGAFDDHRHGIDNKGLDVSDERKK